MLKKPELEVAKKETAIDEPIDKDVGAVANMQMDRENAKMEMMKQTLLERAETQAVSEATCGEQEKMEALTGLFKPAMLKKPDVEAANKETEKEEPVDKDVEAVMRMDCEDAKTEMMKQTLLERAETQAVLEANCGEQAKIETWTGLFKPAKLKKPDVEAANKETDIDKPIHKDVRAVMNRQMDKEKAKTEMIKQALLKRDEAKVISEANCGEQAKMETLSSLFKQAVLKICKVEVANKDTDVDEYVKPVDNKDIGSVLNTQIDREKAKMEMIKQALLERSETQAVSEANCGEQAEMETLSDLFKHAVLKKSEAAEANKVSDSHKQAAKRGRIR